MLDFSNQDIKFNKTLYFVVVYDNVFANLVCSSMSQVFNTEAEASAYVDKLKPRIFMGEIEVVVESFELEATTQNKKINSINIK